MCTYLSHGFAKPNMDHHRMRQNLKFGDLEGNKADTSRAVKLWQVSTTNPTQPLEDILADIGMTTLIKVGGLYSIHFGTGQALTRSPVIRPVLGSP